MSSVYFFNDKQQLIKIVKSDDLIEVVREREISSNKEELMRNTLSVVAPFDDEITDAGFMGVLVDDYLSLYRIVKVSDPNNRLEFIGIDAAPDELSGYIIKDIRPQNEPLISVANRMLGGSDWQVGVVQESTKKISTNFYYASIKDSLKSLQTHGVEIAFRYKANGNGVTDKYVDFLKQIGTESNKRFTYGDKALSIVKETDKTQIYTSVIGRGKGEEVGDGYGRRIEFDDVEWSKAKGDPLDKPKGQNFLEMPDMTKQYGIPTKNGMRKRETVVIFDDEENKGELLKRTYEALIDLSRPWVQFKTDVLEGDAIGNTVTIHRHDRGYHYKARVFKVVDNLLTGKVECSLGDNLTKTVPKIVAETNTNVNRLDREKTNHYEATEVSKYQSDIIRGAGDEGGSVFLMSPSDVGKGNSRAPFQTVWMNGPNIAQSDNFLVANNKGIGFIEGNFDLDKFKTAWTIDGVLSLGSGMLQIGTDELGRYLEATDKGLEFFRKEDSLGTMGTAAKNFPWVADASDKETQRAIAIELNKGGDFIKLSDDGSSGLLIPSVANAEKGMSLGLISNVDNSGVVLGTPSSLIAMGGKGAEKQIDIQADNVNISRTVNIKGKLMVNGQEVTPGGTGGGGGGWNGEYPPEVTSQADKFAWQMWMELQALGYNKEAAAGILGNVQGEVGPSMNPDTAQVGGPAYGMVQWDGSAYPLVGSPTWNGREYVQRLMDKAGIKDDYRTVKAQVKLLDWCMYNGQWIGQVSPTTVSGFKGVSSPETAANAFELNFERPAAAHPERQGWARTWYNKFKNLVPPKPSSKFIPPISGPITVTSEFGWRTSPLGGGQEFHNGIDLVNGNPNTPILASKDGVVEVVGNYPQWYGLYVVIKHADGFYTGYAHNSSVQVHVGKEVYQGTQIANMGTTGPSTAEHCHFQIMNAPWPSSNSGFYNPRPYIFG